MALSLWLIVGIAAGLGTSVLVRAEQTLSRISPDTPRIKAARRALTKPAGPARTVLVLGSDRRPSEPEEGSRSDTLLLVRLDPQRKAVSVMSIPRDLAVSIPGVGGERKINEAYSIGGPELAIDTVEAALGVEINHFVDLNFTGFFDTVQKLGGVYVQVDRRYFNADLPGSSYAPIDIHPGYQRLNGNDALAFVRYRHTDDDTVRGARQQSFLIELRKRASGRVGVLDVPDFLTILEENLRTDVDDLGTVVDLARLVLGLPKGRVFRTSLDVTLGPSFVMASPTQIANSVLRFSSPPLPGGGSALANGRPLRPAQIRVVVQNAGAGLFAADRVTRALRERGYAATTVGDAPAGTPTRTALLFDDRSERAARQLSSVLRDVRAELAPADARLGGRLRLVVGPGFPLDEPFRPKEPPTPEAPPAVDEDPAPAAALAALEPAPRMPLLAPMVRPRSSRLSDIEGVYAYPIQGDDGQRYSALVYTFEGLSARGRYWNVQATTMPEPPILDSPTAAVRRAGRTYQVFYDGPTLRIVAWRQGRAWYWVSNSLDGGLTEKEMLAVADGVRPLPREGAPREGDRPRRDRSPSAP